MGDVAVAGGQEVAAAGDGGGNEQAPAGRVDGWSIAKSLAFRLLIIYFISSAVRNWRGQPPASGPGANVSTPAASPPGRNLFPKDTVMDMYAYISESEKFNSFNDSNALVWSLKDLIYGSWTDGPNGDGSFSTDFAMPCSSAVQNNGSIFVHVFIVRSGKSPDPKSPLYLKQGTIYRSRRLNKYRKKKYQKTANLLTGKTEATEEDIKKAETVQSEILSHWHPNLTLNLVYDQTNWAKGSLPSPLDESVQFDPFTGNYYPIFFFNDYWNLAQEYQVINETVETLNLCFTYAPLSLFRWQMYASQQMRSRWTQVLGSDMFEEDDDQDSLKQAILETNPYLLGLTFVVSILHTIFEFLAFKNDIQFWRSRKSLEGLSVRSVLFNVLTSLIVLLYVLDNETNFVVRVSVFVGLLIELWKIPKCMNVTVDRENPWLGILPRIGLSDKGSYAESATRRYDILAFKYLSWLCFPLLGGYAVYSLLYLEHRGWYSWVLGMLYGFLLTFGFIMMTPQLFINYKLKSVAHLPWRMLSYKFLNTFIDDIFAFVIRMPMMYRIGCFRDDIVFLIYLYQRWIYRVDLTRVNEFGTSGQTDSAAPDADAVAPDADADAVANGPAEAPPLAVEDKKTK